MKCPRCERAELVEMDREGVTIDRCDKCRGIWLDRGELEKLIAKNRVEDEETDRGRDRDRKRDDDDDGDRGDDRGRGRGRRAWWEIFD